VEPGVHATRFESELTTAPCGTELAPEEGERHMRVAAVDVHDLRIENRVSSEPETPPKDLSILTFFSMAAYTQAALEVLGHEPRTRGQERRDGL
jgi:hypothetical protein